MVDTGMDAELIQTNPSPTKTVVFKIILGKALGINIEPPDIGFELGDTPC